MAVSSRVQAVFSANSSGLVSGTRRASTAMEQMQRSVASLSGSMKTLVAIQGAQLFAGITTAVARAANTFKD